MNFEHQQLAGGSWQKLSLVEQMANIGSEVERAIKWKDKANHDYAEKAFFRALELIDLTVDDKKNITRLKEILRTREIFSDFFAGSNVYGSTAAGWQKYFYSFNFAARF
jgi:hypothetical protein